MKTCSPVTKQAAQRRQIIPLVVLAVCLLVAPRTAHAQFFTVDQSATYLNVYFNDGAGTTYPGTTSPYFSGNTTGGEGTPLTAYPGSWLPNSTPGAIPSGTYSATMSTASATATASFQQNNQYNLFFQSNELISASGIYNYGTSLALQNNSHTGVAELRVDWSATYNYTPPQYWNVATTYTPGTYILDGNGNWDVCVTGGTTSFSQPNWPTTQGTTVADNGTLVWQVLFPVWQPNYAYKVGDSVYDGNYNVEFCVSSTGASGPSAPVWPTGIGGTVTDGQVTWQLYTSYQQYQFGVPFNFTLQGAVNNFSAIAGAEYFDVYSGANGGGSLISTAASTLGLGGDFATYGYPPGLQTFAPSGVFTGFDTPYTTSYNYDVIGSPFTPQIIAEYQSVVASGFVDVLVDPGSMQVDFTPPLSIARVSSNPAVMWTSMTTNYILESTTDLASGHWVTNSTGINAANGTNTYIVNPANGAQYFRLKRTN